MLLRRIAIENVRSFLNRQELIVEGRISIIIGPNGGGKTNLLDAIVMMLRRHLFASVYAAHTPTDTDPDRHELRHNDALNNMNLQKHHRGTSMPQIIEVDVEVTKVDIDNMSAMKRDADHLITLGRAKYSNLNLQPALDWNLEGITEGLRLTYKLREGSLEKAETTEAKTFLQYLNLFEVDGRIREEFNLSQLTTPMMYLPTTRSASGFETRVQLANFNESEIKRQSDASHSRANSPIVSQAVGRLATKYRLLLEKSNDAKSKFLEDPNVVELTAALVDLGYEWELACTDPLKNQYDIQLKKQGSTFYMSAASSGERELLTYLFTLYALNVRNALIVIDEPELHLHPQWQRKLMGLFVKLAAKLGNQFLFSTHSPTFVAPDSIQYVSRVFSEHQESKIIRLNAQGLPKAKHLLNIVNSQNNERIFFADDVILVEGISDRIFIEKVLERFKDNREVQSKRIWEVISVGGKGLFTAYRDLLKSFGVANWVIADLDYAIDVGPKDIETLFTPSADRIKKDVIESQKSLDGANLFAAIEQAISTNDTSALKDLWSYIKSRRARLRNDLTETETKELHNFLTTMRTDRLFILQHGALEDYLPEGFRSKDLEKLIEFLHRENFWHELPESAKGELTDVAKLILDA